MLCPKCSRPLGENTAECPYCGIVISKYVAAHSSAGKTSPHSGDPTGNPAGRQTEKRRVSSSLTFAFKYIVYPLLAMAFPGYIVSIFFFKNIHYADISLTRSNITIPAWFSAEFFKWILLVLWVSGIVWSYLVKGLPAIKRVSLDDGSIYISNYLKEIRVPLRSIADVSDTFWGRWLRRGRYIAVTFMHDTAFGEKIVFLPQSMFFSSVSIGDNPNINPFISHPIVDALKDAVQRAKGLEAPSKRGTSY